MAPGDGSILGLLRVFIQLRLHGQLCLAAPHVAAVAGSAWWQWPQGRWREETHWFQHLVVVSRVGHHLVGHGGFGHPELGTSQ